ncbi:hypothetical protein MRB53_012206 [Persea americana]|uniref:Uncharacterized protein n=1 Tax=Persea americana TaxID=3435 RepID=A0ACC2LX66_PERAE|nr:hypothetical protein MRB53_012206 [Persea americana]
MVFSSVLVATVATVSADLCQYIACNPQRLSSEEVLDLICCLPLQQLRRVRPFSFNGKVRFPCVALVWEIYLAEMLGCQVAIIFHASSTFYCSIQLTVKKLPVGNFSAHGTSDLQNSS